MNEPVATKDLLLHLLSITVQASDTTAQLYREIEKVTNGISATLQSESRAEYISNASYDYAIFCDGEMVADVEGDMLLDEMTAETVKVTDIDSATHHPKLTGVNRHIMPALAAVYDGVTLQNSPFWVICRAVTNSTESEPHHPMIFHSVVLTQKLLGGYHA